MAINFPATPNDGDTHEGYVWVAAESAWRRLPEAPAMGIENLNNVSVTTPADGESLVYDSATGEWINADATVEVYGVNTTATDYFMIPVGGDADRPVTPANGHIRFNTDLGEPEYYSETEARWFLFRERAVGDISVEYVVLAGGGAGGGGNGNTYGGGGGGAGGYRSSVSGEPSGGGTAAEVAKAIPIGQSFEITIGAGGSGSNSGWTDGNDSVFYDITSIKGIRGGGTGVVVSSFTGGSGGGGSAGNAGASGTLGQGFDGGTGAAGGGIEPGGGGGGAGSAGENANTDGSGHGGDGGSGVSSSITGSTLGRAGGGGGGASSGSPAGSATDGGGAGGATNQSGSSASANRGGGGGGCGYNGSAISRYGGNGGSGIVILKYPSEYDVSASAGITFTTSTVGQYKLTSFTAGTGTVILS